MPRSVAFAYIAAALAVVALWAWAVRPGPVPALTMPDTTTGVTPIAAVQHVICDNCPTAAAAATDTPTAAPRLVPTFAYPACPARDKELCRIPPVVVTVTAAPIPGCTAATMATMVPNTVCAWHAATSTAEIAPFS